MNKQLLTITSMLLLLGGGIGYANKPRINLKSDRVTIEYGNTVSINPGDYISIENPGYLSSIGFKSALISDKANYSINETAETVVTKSSQYLDVGSYDSYIVYASEMLPLRIDVVDTTPPVFKNFKETVKIPVNSKKEDLEKLFNAIDLSEVRIVIDDSKVKYDKVGEYEIKVKATDAYHNQTEKKCKVKVVSEEEYKKIGLLDITEEEAHKETARISEDTGVYMEITPSVPAAAGIAQAPVPATIPAEETSIVEEQPAAQEQPAMPEEPAVVEEPVGSEPSGVSEPSGSEAGEGEAVVEVPQEVSEGTDAGEIGSEIEESLENF